jgi:ketosteroid isomerase-like protein
VSATRSTPDRDRLAQGRLLSDLPRRLTELPRGLLAFHAWLAMRERPTEQALAKRVARLEAELEVRDLLNRYAYCYDAKDIDALMSIYSEDCVLVNHRGTYNGRAAIRANYSAAMDASQLSFHNLTNLQIGISPDLGEAWATGYLYTVSVTEDGPWAAAATCVFHLQRREGRYVAVESRIHVSSRHSLGPEPKQSSLERPTPTESATSEELVR